MGSHKVRRTGRGVSENTAGREHAYPRVLVVHKAKAARVSCPRIKHHPGLFDLQSQQCMAVLINTCIVTDKQQEREHERKLHLPFSFKMV